MNEIPFSRSHAVQHKIDRSFSCAVRRKVKSDSATQGQLANIQAIGPFVELETAYLFDWLVLDQQIFVPTSSRRYFTYTPVPATFEKKRKKNKTREVRPT